MMRIETANTIAELRSTVIHHPYYERSLDLLTDIVDDTLNHNIASGFVLLGPTGSGKSCLLKNLEKRYPKKSQPEGEIIPLFVFTAPAKCTVKNILTTMLNHFGEFYVRGTEQTLLERLIRLMEGCRTRVVIVDEAQHLVERGTSDTHYLVGDWLKVLVDRLNITWGLCGLPRLQRMVNANEQLRRRWTRTVKPQQWAPTKNNNDLEQIGMVVRQYLKIANMHDRDAELYKSQTLERIWYATNGCIGYLVILLETAIRNSLEADRFSININDLGDAFSSAIWPTAGTGDNPFHSDFMPRRLTKPGEPFFSMDR